MSKIDNLTHSHLTLLSVPPLVTRLPDARLAGSFTSFAHRSHAPSHNFTPTSFVATARDRSNNNKLPYCRHGPLNKPNKVRTRNFNILTLAQHAAHKHMAIGRLYYFTVGLLAIAFCCVSHYHMWPEKGYAPHTNVGNKWRKDPKEEKEKKRKERKERKKRDSEQGRRKNGAKSDTADEPEWIADFSSKRKGNATLVEEIPLSAATAAATAGHPRRVSFEDEQKPNLTHAPSGSKASGYMPYDYIYGKGNVKAGHVANTGSARSPPGGKSGRGGSLASSPSADGHHYTSVWSPDSSGSRSIFSPPTASSKSKRFSRRLGSKEEEDKIYPVQDGYVSPGTRAFSHDGI